MDESVVEGIINRLLDARRNRPGKQVQLPESKVIQLCKASKDIFLNQPCLLELEAPIKIVGDIHGQYSDLLRHFEWGGYPPESNYLFLGNYVDCGKQSLETICLLLAYKIKYPDNFFLLRGNHECASINRIYGFYDECKRRYNNIKLWKVLNDCFNCLPFAALIDNRILCMHGGLSPDLHSLEQIREIKRPTDVPDSGLLCDLLWSNPSTKIQGWGLNDDDDNDVSFTFGADKVTQFMERHGLDLICRGKQVVEDGYEFFANQGLVTIFSAPNYRGEYDNAGAMMSVDATLMCSFQMLKPAERILNFNILENATEKYEDDQSLEKPFGRLNIPIIESSKVVSKSTSTKRSTNAAKYRSNSPGFKVGETSSPNSANDPPNFTFDTSSLYRSKSPGVKPFGRLNIPIIGSSKVASKSTGTKSSTSSTKDRSNSPGFKVGETSSPNSANDPPKFTFDTSNLYRSKSPGVKRYIGPRV